MCGFGSMLSTCKLCVEYLNGLRLVRDEVADEKGSG